MKSQAPDFSPTQTRIAIIIVIIVLLAFPISRLLINKAAEKENTNNVTDHSESDESLQELIEGYEQLSRQDQEKLLSYLDELLNPVQFDSMDESTDENIVSWIDAGDYIGETITVEGTVVASYNSGKACFLNFHEDYSSYFTAVIFKSAFGLFPDDPEDYYFGKTVRVTGTVKEYQGSPEIILDSPDQIEIVK